VHPKVASSLKSYFDAAGDNTVDDCGATVALWLCICPLLSIIPIIGILAPLAALILLIIFYAKASDLTGRIKKTA